jgi:hypothetical protein
MKLPLLLFVLTSFLFSCTKSLDTPPEMIKTNTTGISRSLVRDLDSTVLTVTIAPVVVCYSYASGSAPRPCDTFLEIRCELSRPIWASVSLELTGSSNKQIVLGSAMVLPMIGFHLAPNIKQFIIRENINGRSKEYVTETYSITSVSVYNMIN